METADVIVIGGGVMGTSIAFNLARRRAGRVVLLEKNTVCSGTSYNYQVRAFKTSPLVYALGPRALKRPAAEILFVSSNAWDAIGAAWYGYSSYWVNRLAAPLDQLGARPHGTGSTLADAVDYLFAYPIRHQTETPA
jgi:hypothetical protein